MENEIYMKMLFAIHEQFESNSIIIEWSNGMKVKCKSTSGIFENDAEPEDDDYVGEYSIGVSEIEILQKGSDNSIESFIYENAMEISLKNIPSRIELIDGTILWQKDK